MQSAVAQVRQSNDFNRKRTERYLIRILDNVLGAPENSKFRKLRKAKLLPKLPAEGAEHFLLAVGFVDKQTHFVLPPTVDLSKLRLGRKALLATSPAKETLVHNNTEDITTEEKNFITPHATPERTSTSQMDAGLAKRATEALLLSADKRRRPGEAPPVETEEEEKEEEEEDEEEEEEDNTSTDPPGRPVRNKSGNADEEEDDEEDDEEDEDMLDAMEMSLSAAALSPGATKGWDKWDTTQVIRWLRACGLPELESNVLEFGVEGEDLEIIGQEELDDLDIRDPTVRAKFLSALTELRKSSKR